MLKFLKLFFIIIIRNLRWLITILVSKDGKIVKTTGGKIYLPLKNVSLDLKESNLQKQLALDGIREVLATKEIKKILNKNDNILEIGANIGYFVILEASIIGKGGKIYAIEPEKNNIKLLKKNIKINKLGNQVEVERLAISDREGKDKLHTSKNCNLHSLEKEIETGTKFQDIKTTTIDKYIINKRIDYIRMDIEGYEYKAIKGMEKLLSTNKPLKMFIEIHPHIMGREKTIEMLKTLEKSGFNTKKVISHDTYLRRLLGQAYSKNISIKKLVSIIKNEEKLHAYEIFFQRL